MPALPSSGLLSLSQVQNSFGGSSPIGMSEYYRGGSYVANNAINSSVPTGGAISMSNFYGGAGTTTRSLQVNMDYGYGNSAVGLTSNYFGNGNAAAAPFGFSVGTNTLCYQPVFHAGTGFITSASITIQQNEDVNSNTGHVILYGGTSLSTVTNIVGQWNAGSSGGQGGSRSYSITWDSAGLISAITYTGGYYNTGIISFATNNVSSARSNGYKWYGFRLKNPSGWSKGSDIMTGTFYNSNSYTQPS